MTDHDMIPRAEAEAMVAAALERAAIACTDATCAHEVDEAYSLVLDQGAREQAKASAEAIRARLFEAIALRLLDRGSKDGWCVSIKALHHETGLEHDLLRGCLRAMRGVGLVEYHRGLFSEDGAVAGAGYSLTQRGVAYAEATAPKPERIPWTQDQFAGGG